MGYADGPRYSFMSDSAQGLFHVWDMQEKCIVATHKVSQEAYSDVTRRNRAHLEETCEMCKMIKGGFGPSHFASTLCRSGKHAHCTCDTCF